MMHRVIRTMSTHKWRMLLLALFSNLFAYYGSRLLTQGKPQVCMALPLDDRIPFLPWMVAIYLGSYLFWGVNYMLTVAYDDRGGEIFIRAHILGELICFLTFLLLPTTMSRPELTPRNLMETVVSLVYQSDAPDNLFPSIHCFLSWMCWIGVRRNQKIPKGYRWFSLLFALTICVSTLTVKQHVFVDTAGILLAEGCYCAVTWWYKIRGTNGGHRRFLRKRQDSKE